LLLAALLAALLTSLSCQRVDIDPSVAERPLPRADDPVDPELAAAGETLFRRSCVACHDWTRPVVGPPLGGVTERRSPEWIRAMVLSPDSMVATDSVAAALMDTYAVPMANLQLDEVRFRAIWEYLRSYGVRHGPTGDPAG
ncbi:MAG TPA: cytochrome c, partial [Longimicrobiales bacterium]|nr:cytochrome c [Longimicrobiales bacterium]